MEQEDRRIRRLSGFAIEYLEAIDLRSAVMRLDCREVSHLGIHEILCLYSPSKFPNNWITSAKGAIGRPCRF